MATSNSGYDKLLEQSESIHPGDNWRLEVREIAEEYSTKYTRGNYDRRKYFVVDTEQKEILFETCWDVPGDPGTDGQRKRAIAFRTGYKRCLEEEQAAHE